MAAKQEPSSRPRLSTGFGLGITVFHGGEDVKPGEVLTYQFILQRHLKSSWVAREIGVPVNRITEIQCGRRRITAETALLLARYFKTSAEFWMRLQMEYDLRVAARRSPTTRHMLFETGGSHEL